MTEERRRLRTAVSEVVATVRFLEKWGVEGARETDWYQGNLETLRVQLEELDLAVRSWLSWRISMTAKSESA